MRNAILHISDLHLVQDIDKKNTRLSELFIKEFIDILKKAKAKHNITIKYLVVTGDVSDTGDIDEFEKAEIFLNKLIDEFKIDKKNALICPGNHDINRNDLDQEIKHKKITDPNEVYQLHDVKLRNFGLFYKSFFGDLKPFNPNLAITDILINKEDKIILLGINTCFKEGNRHCEHIGYINKESFENEFQSIDISQYHDYSKLLAMHHNPKALAGEEHCLKNWKEISSITIDYFKTILCGHIHGSDGEALIQWDEGREYYISVGSLFKRGINNTFNLLKVPLENENDSEIFFYELGNPEDKAHWEYQENKKSIKKTPLRELKIDTRKSSEGKLNVFDQLLESQQLLTENSVKYPSNNFNNNELSIDLLMKSIRDNGLFKSGHFHWSETFRSRGIIDVNHLVSNLDTLELVVALFSQKIKNQIGTLSGKTIILGVGIEGNIIGARLSVLFPQYYYSFVPEPLKEDFIEFEKTIKEGTYDNILLIKDIIFEAESMKEILSHPTFSTNQKIFILSLFYCGELNKELLLFEDERIAHISICNQIRIRKCSHDPETHCPIEKYKLETIYQLYSPKEK